MFAEQNTRTMTKQIRLLHLDGRMVAINKSGFWHRLEGVTQTEFGTALQEGDVEIIPAHENPVDTSTVDFAVTFSVCLLIIVCGIILFNTGC